MNNLAEDVLYLYEMAKLSARGRYELYRVEKVTKGDPHKSEDVDIDYRKIVYSFMSDGHVLRKLIVRQKPSSFYPKGETKDFGFKDFKNFSKFPDFEKRFELVVKDMKSKGFTSVKG